MSPTSAQSRLSLAAVVVYLPFGLGALVHAFGDPDTRARVNLFTYPSAGTEDLRSGIPGKVFGLLGDLLVASHAPMWLPALCGLGMAVCLTRILVLGRLAMLVLGETSLPGDLWPLVARCVRDLLTSLALAITSMCISGDRYTRFVPLLGAAIAVLVIWKVARWRPKYPPTRGGSLPSRKARVSRRHRGALHKLRTLDTGGHVLPAGIRVLQPDGSSRDYGYFDVVQHFASANDPVTASYAFSTGVEALLRRGELGQAERLVSLCLAPNEVEFDHQPTESKIQGARAEPLLSHDRGNCVTRYTLLNLLGVTRDRCCHECQQSQSEFPQRKQKSFLPRSPRNEAIALRAQIEQLRPSATPASEQGDPPPLHRFAELLVAPVNTLSDIYWIQFEYAIAVEHVATSLERAGAHQEAALHYFTAGDNYRQVNQSLGSVRCATRGIRLGLFDLVAPPDDALENLTGRLHAGLRIVDHFRRQIGDSRYRVLLTTSQENAFHEVFDLFTPVARIRPASAAADLCQWIIEALKNSSLREAEPPQAEVPEPEAERDPRVSALVPDHAFDEISIDQAHGHFDDDITLTLNAARDRLSWTIRGVARWNGRSEVFRSTLFLPLDDDAPITAGGQLLDRLANADAEDLDYISNAVALTNPAWREIANAVVPPPLRTYLVGASQRGSRRRLVIAPEGPLTRVPFAGLPLGEEILLVDSTDVMLTPSLSMESSTALTPPRSVVAHFDTQSVDLDASRERQAWAAAALALPAVSLQEVASAAAFVSALGPAVDLVFVSAHGDVEARPTQGRVRFQDGSVLTLEQARAMRWPEQVVLGSCWLGLVDTAKGTDPIGFPTACLRRGAKVLVGSVAPLIDDTAGSILARIVPSLIREPLSVARVWDSVRAELHANPELRRAPSVDWAVLSVWGVATSREDEAPDGALRVVEDNERGSGATDDAEDERGSEAVGRALSDAEMAWRVNAFLSRRTDLYPQDPLERVLSTSPGDLLTVRALAHRAVTSSSLSGLDEVFQHRLGTGLEHLEEGELQASQSIIRDLGATDAEAMDASAPVRLTHASAVALVHAVGLATLSSKARVDVDDLLYGLYAIGVAGVADGLELPANAARDPDWFEHYLGTDLPSPQETLLAGIEALDDSQPQPTHLLDPRRDETEVGELPALAPVSIKRRLWALGALMALVVALNNMVSLDRTEYRTGYIGAPIESIAAQTGIPYLGVRDVPAGSPAYRGGLRTGDVIEFVDGQRVGSAQEFIRVVRQHKPGDVLHLGLIFDRGRQHKTIEVVVGSHAEDG